MSALFSSPEYGLPLKAQTGNDKKFAKIADPRFPTPLSLWLIGLGVTHIHSRPHHPTDQAPIERQHRTQGDWAWNDRAFQDAAQIQAALDADRLRYNQDYPSQAAHCHGAAPFTVFPTATPTGGRITPD
jgi:hypothetical protein